MNIKKIIKSTWFYKKVYYPCRWGKIKKNYQKRRAIFVKEGENALKAFVDCMNKNCITYWLEFGSLLGAYRDGDFVPNEIDIDTGAYLKDARTVYEALVKDGFKLVREFHIVGENGLEQTYEYHGTTIDVMYFFEKDELLWCNGAQFIDDRKNGKLFEHIVTAHYFEKFECVDIQFLGMNVSVPSNTEEHLIEIYGEGFRVYDPNFKGDLNKIYYSLSEKKGIGFMYY